MNRLVEFRPVLGAYILETLTLGMYGETKIAIREYVQNAFDSLQEAVSRGLLPQEKAHVELKLHADHQGITIRDNGMGIRTESAVQVLAAVGASNKSFAKNAGFRGIGRLAGIVFCDSLIFTTKAAGQTERTVVAINAKKLREKLAPDSENEDDAAKTLAACVEAHIEPDEEKAAHYFEVRMEGYHEPPKEAKDIIALKIFLQQVSPLPFSPKFSFAKQINDKGREVGLPIESIHVFVKDGDEPAEEIFKPYTDQVQVKAKTVPIALEFVQSPTQKWWGWVGRKKVPGIVKDVFKGIRVRMKNIQIDDVDIMREIFAYPIKESAKARSSYLRFAEWYIGEVHVAPAAAVPNARRDGFEENDEWKALREELEDEVYRLGKEAYRTSKGDQISIENIQRLFANLKASVDVLQPGNWDRLSQLAAEAVGVQNRIAQASAIAEEEEKEALRTLHANNLALKARIQELTIDEPPAHDCEEEIAKARSKLTQTIYTELRDRLGPTEWKKAMHAIQNVTGEPPH